MAELFQSILESSLSASFLVLAVIAARLVLKNAPRWMLCGLWALVAIRLLCPISLESSISLVPDMETASLDILQEPAVYPLPGKLTAIESVPVPSVEDWKNTEQTPYLYATIEKPDGTQEIVGPMPATDMEISWLEVLSFLWPLGVLVMIGYAAFSYLHIRRSIRVFLEVQKGVRLCDRINSPFILGLLKPQIYLPSNIDPADIPPVLAHEQAHLKRRDHWWKPLGYFLLALHWFNPLLWAAYILLCRDIELACDERVVKGLLPQQRKAYSEALLNCSLPRKSIAACPLAFGEVVVKQRIKSVLRYKKPSFWILVLTAIIGILVAVCFLTDPEKDTLSHLCGIERTRVSCIDLRNLDGIACVSLPEDIDALWDSLKSIEYIPEPHISDTDWTPEDYYQGMYLYLEFNIGEEQFPLFLYDDFTSICWVDENGNMNHYRLKSPAAAEALMEQFIDPVARCTVTAEPFATMDDAAKWLQEICPEAVYSAGMRYHSNTIINGSKLSKRQFQELLNILNEIPSQSLSDPEGIQQSYFDRITYLRTNKPNVTVTFEDQANQLAVMLRYYEDDGSHLEILMSDELTVFDQPWQGITRAHKWDIDSPELLAYMQKLAQYQPGISMFKCYWLDIAPEPLTLSDGTATLSLMHIRDWTYGITEPTEHGESFGFRVRPAGETSGWLYFSFWPDGYTVEEKNRHYYTWETYDGITGYSSYPLDVITPGGHDYTLANWSYQKWCTDIGDFVILNEYADSWLSSRSEEVGFLLDFGFEFSGGKPIDVEIPKSVIVPLRYTQSDDPKRGVNQLKFDMADKAHMTLSRGWLYDDTVSDQGGCATLCRFWPEYETEGYISVEYWEGFFQPEDGYTVTKHWDIIPGRGYPVYTAAAPGESRWTYLWVNRNHGSYVFRCEDTAHWSDANWYAAIGQIASHTFQN